MLVALILRQMYRRRAKAWASRLPRRGLVLEIGSGDGWMLRALKHLGWQVIGSERTIGQARFAYSEGVPMFVGDMSATLPESKVDLIVMFHVLEHLYRPDLALSDAAQRLRPGGTIVIGVPNLASWQARLFRGAWFHLDAPRHLFHFSPRAIRVLLEQRGFQEIHIEFRSPEHDPYGWVQSAENVIGFEHNLLLKILTRSPFRSSAFIAGAALALSVPLSLMASVLTAMSWLVGAGAIMEIWAVRSDVSRDRSGADR